jgi:hypothetical protein
MKVIIKSKSKLGILLKDNNVYRIKHYDDGQMGIMFYRDDVDSIPCIWDDGGFGVIYSTDIPKYTRVENITDKITITVEK